MLADELLAPSIIGVALIALVAGAVLADFRRRSDRVTGRQARKLEKDYLRSRR